MKLLVLSFGVAVALLAGVQVVQWTGRADRASADAWVEHTRDVLAHIDGIERTVTEAETAARGYLLTGDEGLRAAYERARDDEPALSNVLASQLSDNPRQMRRLAELAPLMTARLFHLELGGLRRRLFGEAVATMLTPTGEGRHLMKEVGARLEAMRATETELLASRNAACDETQALLDTVAVAGGLLGLAVVGLAFATVVRENRRRRAGEQALSAQRDLLSTIVGSMTEAVWWKDHEGCYRLMNPAGAKMFGRPLEAIIGRHDRELLEPEQLENAAALDRRILETGRSETLEVEGAADEDGSASIYHMTRSPLRDQTGAIVGIVCAALDITDRTRAEAQRLGDMTLLAELGEIAQLATDVDELLALVPRVLERGLESDGGAITLEPMDGGIPRRRSWGKVAREPVIRIDATLAMHGEMFGAFVLETPERLGLEIERRKLTYAIAEHLSLALANLRMRERLRSQSLRDPLTGLHNRRYLEESLAREVARSARTKGPIAVAVLDVDHFKRFNDAHGHEAGDAVLKALGALLQSRVRASDILCRYGGEEIVIVLPDCSLEDAARRVELMRQDVRALALELDGTPLGRLTVSAGVAVWPEHGATAAELVRSADLALYRAKREGRDRLRTAMLGPTLVKASSAA